MTSISNDIAKINKNISTINNYTNSLNEKIEYIESILNPINKKIIGNIDEPSDRVWYVEGNNGIVVCADNYASQVGIQCLKNGGNAFDATVATMAVLGLTKPGNCGLGGGGYANIYNASTKCVETIDFRETAPLKTNPYCFVDSSNNTVPFTERRQQGTAVGVPGTPMFMKVLLERYGTLNLEQCFYPAIELAKNGFVVDETLNTYIDAQKAIIANFEESKKMYLDSSNNAIQVGTVLKNENYGNTLQLLANTNCKAFYNGEIAIDIVNCVNNPKTVATPNVNIKGGVMSLEDLSLYNVRIMPPIKTKFRDVDVYSVAPSTSGGLLIAQGLMLYENLMPTNLLTNTEMNITKSYYSRLMAMRYAFADRNKYIADPLFYPVPTNGLVNKTYVKSRSDIIPDMSNVNMNTLALFGTPPNTYINSSIQNPSNQLSEDPTRTTGSTTGLVIVDKHGNISCIVFTIEQIFGSGMTVPNRGFILNNELTDFNVLSIGQNMEANSPEPCKRPRSSTAPTLVFKDGQPLLALSSAGGTNIPSTIFNSIINYVDYKYSIPNVLLEGRYFQANGTTTTTDSLATQQKDIKGSLFSLITKNTSIPSSHFVFASATAIPTTNMAIVAFYNGLLKGGFNWPKSATNKVYGSSKVVIQNYYENTNIWKPLL